MTTTAFADDALASPSDPFAFDPFDTISGGVARLSTTPVAELTDAALMKEAVGLQDVISKLEARRLGAAAELQTRGCTEVATGLGTATWMARNTLVSRRSAARSVRLGSDLRDRLPRLAERFALGLLPVEMAQVAAGTIRDLRAGARSSPADVAAIDAAIATADELLSGYSAYLSADDFELVARRMTATISALAAEDSFETKLERRRLSVSQLLDGSWKLDGLLDPEAGALVSAALDPLSRPLGVGEHRTAGQRRADALAELCGQYLNSGLAPIRGTVRPHLHVLLDGSTLARGADPGDASGSDPARGGSADLGRRGPGPGDKRPPVPGRTGAASSEPPPRAPIRTVRAAIALLRERAGLADVAGAGTVPPSVWERIACDAVLRRVVLDPDGMPLDVGHASRQPTGAQRAALIVRDGGCAHPGCGRPAAWTDAHHIVHWLRGGETNLRNLLLLCRFHHGAIHRGSFRVELDGAFAVFSDRGGRELGRHRMRAGP